MVGDERDEQPQPRRVGDRDLLWVESVSERLLGTSAPRAWEKAFFRSDDEEAEAPQTTTPRVPMPDEFLQSAVQGAPRQDAPSYPAAPPPPPAGPSPGYAHPEYQPPAPVPSPAAGGFPGGPPPAAPYFSEGDADWRHDLGPEFPEDEAEDELDAGERSGLAEEPETVIDLTDPVPVDSDAGWETGVDDEVLRLALVSGDTVLATAVLQLLEVRSRERQRIATLETALRALVEVVDRIDAPDHELAVTARLLRRVVRH